MKLFNSNRTDRGKGASRMLVVARASLPYHLRPHSFTWTGYSYIFVYCFRSVLLRWVTDWLTDGEYGGKGGIREEDSLDDEHTQSVRWSPRTTKMDLATGSIIIHPWVTVAGRELLVFKMQFVADPEIRTRIIPLTPPTTTAADPKYCIPFIEGNRV